MKAVIMAGGFGTRLRPLTCNIPKPMVPMLNRPMMEHIVDLLKRHGITDLIATLYYQPDVISSYFDDGHRFGVSMQFALYNPSWQRNATLDCRFTQNGTPCIAVGTRRYMPVKYALSPDGRSLVILGQHIGGTRREYLHFTW